MEKGVPSEVSRQNISPSSDGVAETRKRSIYGAIHRYIAKSLEISLPDQLALDK
jgi:hypothetical protein